MTGDAMLQHQLTRVRSPHRAETNVDAGFTLIEMLIVIIVLGILAAVVVFALNGASNQSVTAACDADARTVNVAADAYLTEHPLVTQVTEAQLVAASSGTLPSWPTDSSSTYTIVIAGDGNSLAGQSDADGNTISDNDVLVKIGANYYDATASLPGACASA